MNSVYRVALLPFGRNRRRGVARESADLIASADTLNVAAEHYFRAFDEPAFLLDKPFSDSLFFPRHLINLGTLLEGIRLRRADVVLELGAGSCWASHFVNRFGCKTVSVDVSHTALDLGREMFRRDPATRWDLNPEFLAYDGHRLPIADGSCTKVLIVDAFHHVPNQREILTELHRVLGPDGIVGMSEPGTGHADTEASKKEVQRFGVLENELVIEDLAALAKSCGFTDVRLIVSNPTPPWEIAAEDLGPFLQGKGFTRYWEQLCDTMVTGHYILLYKGDPRPTTRQPKAIHARIRIGRAKNPAIQTGRGQPTAVQVTLTNLAETRWLAGERPDGGWTRLGAHLYRDGQPPVLIDFDWLRVDLPRDVARDETATLPVMLPPIDEPGIYRVIFDLVIEGQTWFADRGSVPLELTLRVDDRSAPAAPLR